MRRRRKAYVSRIRKGDALINLELFLLTNESYPTSTTLDDMHNPMPSATTTEKTKAV